MIHVLLAHISEPPKPLTEHRPDVPADLQAVVLRCLAKQPAERFPDVQSLEQALPAVRRPAVASKRKRPRGGARARIGRHTVWLRQMPTDESKAIAG
jgi:hypothetical protein